MDDGDLLALYERTVGEVFSYASRLTGGDRSWADELVQETFLGLLRRIRAGQEEGVELGWLIVSCRRRFLDDLKHSRRRRDRERRAGMPPASSERGGPAVEALSRVPAEQRAALVLKYVDDLPVADVARELGRSVHATESLLARGRASLRATMTEGAS